MKNPTSRTANRTIDVIFVHPKHRSYVIWHNHRFYQLTRMALSVRAWERKVAYTGSLDEIFVAKESCEQGEIDNVLQEIGLTTVKLPSELHSITANKFLAWWTVNRYGFWHAKDNTDNQTPTPQDLPASPSKASPKEQMPSPTSQTAMPEPASVSSTPVAPPPRPKPIANHLPLNELSGDDIFEALFDDLVEEVEHLK